MQNPCSRLEEQFEGTKGRVCVASQLGEKFFVMIATVSDDDKDDLLNKLTVH